MINTAPFQRDSDRLTGNRKSTLLYFGLAGTVVMVLMVLLHWTLTTGLECDELLFLRAIELGPIGGLMAEGSSHPPLFRWVVGIFCSADSPDWLLRTPSILASMLTVVVWFFIFDRIFDNDYVVLLLLPLVACGSGWLEIGYQLTPYAFLTLLCSLHCLFWLRLLEKKSFMNICLFVITGVAPIWSHFYGANILVSDQIIWMCLMWKTRELWRLWITTSFTTLLLVLPVVPIALFYVQLEQPFTIVQIADYPSYFVDRSIQMFSKMTFNIIFTGMLTAVWYVVVGGVFLQWMITSDSAESSRANAARQKHWNLIILCGFFLAGIPATQAHSLLTEKAMWSRYAVLATWVHWPLMILFLQTVVGKKTASAVSSMALAWCLFAFFSINQMQQLWTFDHGPAITLLSENAQPADAYFAQDMDLWIGEANFDRLWFERYSPVVMPIITADVMGRFELMKNGLSFDAAPKNIQRIWVCSDLYSERSLKKMEDSEWQLIMLDESVPWRPVALFARAQNLK